MKCLKLFRQMKLCHLPFSSGLKRAEKKLRTSMTTQEVCWRKLLEMRKQLQRSELVTATNQWLKNCWLDYCISAGIKFIGSFMKIWERERCEESVFHTEWQTDIRSTEWKLVKNLSRPNSLKLHLARKMLPQGNLAWEKFF